MPRQRISIVICTYNRAAVLKETLNSFFQMTLPPENEFELLIVDNNSNDATAEVIRTLEIIYPKLLRYTFESKPGLSNARNTGIREAQGQIIAFVDDDVFFGTTWLIETLNIFKLNPHAHCMGGKSIPQFAGGRPEWVTDDLLILYGSTNSGEEIKKMIYPEHPFGLNMAFRREVFDTLGNFGTHLGRKKNNLLSNEEADFFLRMHNAGLTVLYTPNALIHHRIPIDRVHKDWVISRFYWQGVSDIAFHQAIKPSSIFQLFQSIFHDLQELIASLTGGYCSLRKAYWHFNARQLQVRISQAYLRGKIKQMIREALRFNK